jgi:hypothetical protein
MRPRRAKRVVVILFLAWMTLGVEVRRRVARAGFRRVVCSNRFMSAMRLRMNVERGSTPTTTRARMDD